VPDKPTTEFGKRRPAAIPAAQPVKRSGHVALLLMGTFAVGGGAYALMPRENCVTDRPGMASELPGNAGCRPHGSSSGGSHIGSRSGFFSSDTSSSRSQSGAASSDAGSGSVTRGGFGGFAHAFASHFSGGG
jgi:hypothetical protein